MKRFFKKLETIHIYLTDEQLGKLVRVALTYKEGYNADEMTIYLFEREILPLLKIAEQDSERKARYYKRRKEKDNGENFGR